MAQYNQVTPEIVERLQAIAPGRVYTGADVNEDYSRDEMPIYGTRMPDVAIDAMSTEAGTLRPEHRKSSKCASRRRECGSTLPRKRDCPDGRLFLAD